MQLRKPLVPTVTAALILNLLVVSAPAAVGATAGFSRQISSSGTTVMRSGALGSGAAFEDPEFRGSPGEGPEEDATDRSQSVPVAPSVTLTESAKKTKSSPELKLDFQGLNHRDQRLANGGNQFSLEPPDQGLCVGNGYVLETLNDVLRVYNTAGTPVTGVIDQNTFYGYQAAINRSTGVRGPFVTDPECLFDVATQRWFHTVLTLEVNPTTGAFLGPNHIDLAVSQTPNPTGAWTIWRIPVQNDGTEGTPNHHCTNPDAETKEGPCIGDYPHIGIDAYGFYFTTNEYAFFGPEFKSSNIYAISKAALVAGASTITVTQFETVGLDNGNPGFTLRPSMTPGTAFELGAGGTEYFMSSNAAEEASGNPDGTSDDLLVWALSNTSSLATATPALSLSHTTLTVGEYSVPPKANQKVGSIPLGECINDTTLTTPFGLGCWQFLFVSEPAHDEVESTPDSGDSRMMQVTFANGKLWGALDTGLEIGGATKAGIEWFIVKPTISVSGVSAVVQKSGYLGLAGNNLTYPAIGVTNSGRGAMVFTLLGDDNFPSAAFAPIDAQVGVGDIAPIEPGKGPADGFTSYKAFVGDPPRTRWGDYSAAATDGNSIWLGTEYIESACTFAQYIASPFGSCGGTRTSLGNWSTRIAKVVP
jgi:hypothetical protein